MGRFTCGAEMVVSRIAMSSRHHSHRRFAPAMRRSTSAGGNRNSSALDRITSSA